jgi:hypothetical protein
VHAHHYPACNGEVSDGKYYGKDLLHLEQK